MSLRSTIQTLVPAASRCASTSAGRQPKAPTPPPSERIYTDRKTYLYDYYTHLLQTSQLVLLFQHDNLSVADLQKTDTPTPRASLTILRTGILSALTRHQSIPFPKLKGQTALLTSPTLSPKYMSQILTSIQRTIKKNQREGTKDQLVKQPELKLLFGYVEGRQLLEVGDVDKLGKLPDLDGLRSQLVGLLEMRGRELVGVLGQAGGGGLVRTLQGRENDLKGEAEA
jgi:large subunit ribosomal protein L10